jgi:hypothetical protein
VVCYIIKAKSQSVITVQREFIRKFNNDPPSDNICRWYRQFQENGGLCKGKKFWSTKEGLANCSKHNDFSCGVAIFIPSAVWRLKRKALFNGVTGTTRTLYLSFGAKQTSLSLQISKLHTIKIPIFFMNKPTYSVQKGQYLRRRRPISRVAREVLSLRESLLSLISEGRLLRYLIKFFANKSFAT